MHNRTRRITPALFTLLFALSLLPESVPGPLATQTAAAATITHMVQAWQTSGTGSPQPQWVDYDDDGDLDLDLGTLVGKLFRNDGGVLTSSPALISAQLGGWPAAWGDMDGDGDLDGVDNQGRIFRNNGSGSFQSPTAAVTFTSFCDSPKLALGDVDGDRDPDAAIGCSAEFGSEANGGAPNGGQELLYRNDGGTLSSTPIWSSTVGDSTVSLAWGDYDGDGDLDLATGNGTYLNIVSVEDLYGEDRIYRNDNGNLTTDSVWQSTEDDETAQIQWADYDGDGDLDLAASNFGNNKNPVPASYLIYQNNNNSIATSATKSYRSCSISRGEIRFRP